MATQYNIESTRAGSIAWIYLSTPIPKLSITELYILSMAVGNSGFHHIQWHLNPPSLGASGIAGVQMVYSKSCVYQIDSIFASGHCKHY